MTKLFNFYFYKVKTNFNQADKFLISNLGRITSNCPSFYQLKQTYAAREHRFHKHQLKTEKRKEKK